MANMRTYNRSFAGGEISPQMYGRIDDAKFQTGAAKMLNFVATPTGSATNRPGFAFVKATKNNGVARLIPFTYSLNQTMVIELGAGYARFHTQGETLQYTSTGMAAWIPPAAADITYTLTTPAIFTWSAHGMANGDSIQFYLNGVSAPPSLPGSLKMGYTYTVNVIDANTFIIIDPATGYMLAFALPAGGSTTNYPGTGTTSIDLNDVMGGIFYPSATSSTLSGLASTAVTGGIATLTANISYAMNLGAGGVGAVDFEYSTDGVKWKNFYSYTQASGTAAQTQTVTVAVPLTNLDQLQLRIVTTCSQIFIGSVSITGTINSWSVQIPTAAPPASIAGLRAYVVYMAGDTVTYSGAPYVAKTDLSGGQVTPGTNAAVWYALPTDLTYEIATPYTAADLFNIHYIQSMDVMTLVHQNYPPAELQRRGATSWAYVPIAFGPPLATPANVAVAASPGYLAKIASVTNGTSSGGVGGGVSEVGNAMLTTVSNHTLALGDGVYLANLTFTPTGGTPQVLDGFYMVACVPSDGSGNLINDEVYLMDYSGNNLPFQSGGTYSTGATLQYGTKIFNITNYYAVQAIAKDNVSTSLLSASCNVLNNLDVPGSFNTITWSSVPTAANYNVYKQLNGLWGFIGNTTALTFTDDNIAPDMSIVPGTPDTNTDGTPLFSTPGNYPAAVSYFQQRRTFAATVNKPNNVWMSNSGTESMFSYSLPAMDTDRVAFQVAALKADVIQHLMPMIQLILLTSESEFAVVPGGTNAITPSTVAVNPQSYVGASNVQPTIINTTMVYAAARGGHVRELGYAWTVNGYMTGDLSLRAAHLFDNFTIVDQAYSKSPYPIVWFVSSSGKLLGLTYIPEEQLGAWHEHTTLGSFESIACVAEGNEDVLYAVINRTIGGVTVRYIERMASLVFDDNLPDAFFMDAGATQTFSAPVTQISGLTWLEGQTVAVLADGGVQSNKIVAGGAITLDHAASTIQVGLPYDMDLMTLPAVLQLDGYGQGRNKNINKAWVKVYQSSGILVGPDEDHLTEIMQRTTEPYGSPPALQTAELEILTTPSWQAGGQTLIRQQNPLPLTVAGLTMEVSIGG